MGQSIEHFVREWAASGLLTEKEAQDVVAALSPSPRSAEDLGRQLVRAGRLTRFQAQIIYQGKGRSLQLGNYQILDKLGAGGMGQVFLAEHRHMKRRVGVKVLPARMTRDSTAVDRFRREVQAAARLSHPNIVTAHDADETMGVHFLVMEYVEGIDLSKLVKDRGRLPIEQAVDCISQAARGLSYAHERGVLHRDVKPSNLLLSRDGVVKILDMGLACLSDADGTAEHDLTGTGMIMGTLDYMAPEQGVNTRHADTRSDVYSLGCTLYYLLTGHPLYPGGTAVEKILAHREKPIPSLAEHRKHVPQPLVDIFEKMVAKQPGDRFQSMAHVVVALQMLLTGPVAFASDQTNTVSALRPFVDDPELSSKPTALLTEDSDRATRPLGPKSHAPTIVTGFLSDTQNVLPTRLHERKEPAGGKRGPSLNRGWLIGGGVILAIAIGVAFLVTGGRDDSDVARSDATVTASVEPTAVAAVHGGVSPSAPVANGTTLGGQSIESTPGVSADVDREVTEEVLRLGGYVQYFDFSDHSKGSIESAQQIINKPFKVYLIGFRKPVSLSDSLTHKLRSLTRLQAVHFGAAVDDSTVENVASLVRVQQLAFFQRGESTDALSLLADLPQLTSLTIPSSILTEAHWLPQLSRLQALRIPYGIEPVEDAILMQCPQLRTIHFSGKTRPLTDDQCRMIQQQRPQLRFVQGNGAEARCLTADPTRDAAATLMKLGAKLEVVDLPYGASRSLKSADLESSRPFLPIDVCLPASVGWSPELEAALSLCHINGELRIPNRSQLRPYLVAVRDHQPGIETLDISHGTITDEDLALIAEMPGLRKLVATGTGLGPEDFTSLREPLPDCSIQLDERYLPAVSDTPQRMFR